MSSRPVKTPELLLEQLHLGELSPEDERLLRARLAPAEIEARLRELGAADAEFARRCPADAMVRSIEGRVRTAAARKQAARRPSRTFMVMLPSMAALALAGIWVVRSPAVEEQRGPGFVVEGPDEVRIKGHAPRLSLYRRHGDQVETLGNGAHAAQGDMLQVGYVSADASHGVIVSIDGSGAVTLHFPDTATGSTKLETQGEQLLTHAYELDAAPRFERFFFVTGRAAVDVQQVLSAAQKLASEPERALGAPLSLAPKLRQHTLTLVKESSR